MLAGESNSVVNCYIHDTDYIGTYASCVQLYGKGNVLSHCTLTRSGRTVLDYRGMYQALVQYNDMSHSGLLTSDLGLTYGNVIEGGNSEVRYNWLHDNDDDHVDMGLYYDHGTQNIISHHNVVWGVGYSAFLINFYGYYHLVYNNSFSADKNGFRSAWGNKYPPDLYGCRFFNNIFSGICYTSADNYAWGYNYAEYKDLIDNKYLPGDSSLIDQALPIAGINDDYSGNSPDPGAYESEGYKWIPGHDFDNPPVVNTPHDPNRSSVTGSSMPRSNMRTTSSPGMHHMAISPSTREGRYRPLKTSSRFAWAATVWNCGLARLKSFRILRASARTHGTSLPDGSESTRGKLPGSGYVITGVLKYVVLLSAATVPGGTGAL